MILNTQQQAQNFVLYILQSCEWTDDMDSDELTEALRVDVCLVFGNHTFSEDALNEVVRVGMVMYDQNY